jgi:GntR family galactonate operon transcriptional repressor
VAACDPQRSTWEDAVRKGAKPGKIGSRVSSLGAAIVRGDVPPGTILPPEHALEAQYGAARSVVREAMKTLAAKGLVSVRPRHGTHVRPAQDWTLLDRDVLAWLRVGGLDRDLLLALEETRAIIEPAAAALAAQRATREDRERIHAALVAMHEGRDDPQAAIAADKAFHLAILDATHNPVLRSFRGAIDTILSALFDITVGVFAGNLANHAAVARAIEARDPHKARRAMEKVLGYTDAHLRANGRKPVRKAKILRTKKSLRSGKRSTGKTDKE